MSLDSDAPGRLMARIRRSVIGDGLVLYGPFGPRRLLYADYTASGRALSFVEDAIRDRVLPMYANTHTEASATGRYVTALREESRRYIHGCVGGGEDDVVLFCGTGVTGAIDRLIRVLGLRRRGPTHGDDSDRPVVFVGPYEHHSNELPWREAYADVVAIREAASGGVDLEHLAEQLRRFADRPLKVGSFSAASNVSGIVTDPDPVSILLHRHGALACWDYATAGPYLPVDMNPVAAGPDGHLAYKDAVAMSPHKFVGGPDTPGLLIAKRRLFGDPVPTVPGGGTILFVSTRGQAYHPAPEVREEGGTPAIVGAIRAGLAFAVKHAVGTDAIRVRDEEVARQLLAAWAHDPRIVVLGNTTAPRLPIVSLGLRHGTGMLHGNFVTALLNDLFGIQARNGCFCAGPYVHRSFPIGDDWSRRMQAEVVGGNLGAKLSFTRISIPYFASKATVDYVVAAVLLLAEHAGKLLPQYRFDPVSGAWWHRSAAGGAVPFRVPGRLAGSRLVSRDRVLRRQLAAARRVLTHPGRTPAPEPVEPMSDGFEDVRWFPLPAEIHPNPRPIPAEPPVAVAGLGSST
jgi:selenocysteine lyase/cysteine desulfurase